MPRINKEYTGKWRIQEMDAWDKDYIDLVVPGHITIKKDGTGTFQFGAVGCEIDARIENDSGSERIEFTFEGSDEGDQVSGRGWALLKNKKIEGKLYFHLGDDSGFIATKT